MNTKKKFIIISFVTLLIIAAFMLNQSEHESEFKSVLILEEPIQLPDFSLIDHEKKPVSKDTFKGQWDLIFFGFTNCPDICPTTIHTLNLIKQKIKKSDFEKTLRIALVSVDPERDTPLVLSQYINYFGDQNIAITGDIEEMTKLTKALGIFFEKVFDDYDNYTVNHSAAVLLINPAAEFSALFSAPHILEDFIDDLKKIMDDYL
ncbi:MAG: SCO family protein [Woeseia sp.]|nr:SCO family protein [Woeseia sp.]|tara:strand:- start:6042 stop:6656 length:615 start_codon:yes stop_codon:yes gene_type:complete